MQLGSAALWARTWRRLRAAWPMEAWAIGFGRNPWQVCYIQWMKNASPSSERFEADPRLLIPLLHRAHGRGFAPTLFVHAHPRGGASFSAADRRSMHVGGIPRWPGAWHAVVSTGDAAPEIALRRVDGVAIMHWSGRFDAFVRRGLAGLRGTVWACSG